MGNGKWKVENYYIYVITHLMRGRRGKYILLHVSPHLMRVTGALSAVEKLKGSLPFIFVNELRSQGDTVSSTA